MEYFSRHEGTCLDAAEATGIHQDSMRWRIGELRAQGLLVVSKRAKDHNTGAKAQYYTIKVAADMGKHGGFVGDLFSQEGGAYETY